MIRGDLSQGSPRPSPSAPGVPAEARPRRTAGRRATSRSTRRGAAAIRTLDFSQPTKFTAELRRQIARVLGPFCEDVRRASPPSCARRSSCASSDSSQLTWSAAQGAARRRTRSRWRCRCARSSARCCSSIELPLVLQALECLLGGTAAQAPAERRLSEIDWALTRGMLRSIVGQLGPAWRDLGGLELELRRGRPRGRRGRRRADRRTHVRAHAREPHRRLRSAHVAADPLVGDRAGRRRDPRRRGHRPHEADPREPQAVQRGLAERAGLLRAEVGSRADAGRADAGARPRARCSRSEARRGRGARCIAEGVALGRGRPGLRGTRRAIKLTSTIARRGRRAAVLDAGRRRGEQGRRRTRRLSAQGAGEEGSGRAQQAERGLGRWSGCSGCPCACGPSWAARTCPSGSALELPPGTVVELDQGAETPIELFANGLCFAHGQLLVSAEGEWAVQVQKLV